MLEYLERLWDGAAVDAGYRRAMRAALPQEAGEVSGTSEVPLTSPASSMDLPVLAYDAAGGASPCYDTHRQLYALTAAWRLLYVAAHLLDDVEDGDDAVSPPDAIGTHINTAAGLYETANLALCDLDALGAALGAGRGAVAAVRREFHQTLLAMCAGQHADLNQPERRPERRTLERCWHVAEAKSGAFFALACRAGARLANAGGETLRAFGEFGRHLGVLIQIRNDAGGLVATPGRRSDLASPHRLTLPVAYALHVLAAPQREQLLALLRAAPADVHGEKEVLRRVVESGALLFLAAEVEQRRRRAEAALCGSVAPSRARAELLSLLNELAGGAA